MNPLLSGKYIILFLAILFSQCCYCCGESENVPWVKVRFSGVLGQSQPADKVSLHVMNFSGVVIDDSGNMWAGKNRNIFQFTKSNEGSWVLANTFDITMEIHPKMGLRSDGRIIYFISNNYQIYSFSPAQAHTEISPNLVGKLLPGAVSFAVSPDGINHGYSAKWKFLYLYGDNIVGMTKDCKIQKTILRLRRLPDNGKYCAVGIEPQRGDMLVGSMWPDSKIYKFDIDGQEIHSEGWPRGGFALQIISFPNISWAIGYGGAWSLPATVTRMADIINIRNTWLYHVNGFSQDDKGNYILSCLQGIAQANKDDLCCKRRIGGLPGVNCMVVAPDGTLIAAVENGRLMIRFFIDDQPDTLFQSGGNEAWRIGNNWLSHSVAIKWNKDKFIVLDDIKKQLWSFDPWHVQWMETPWIPLTKEMTFKRPRALAVGNLYLWILDGSELIEIDRQTFKRLKKISLLDMNDITNIDYIDADNNDNIYIGTHTSIYAFRREIDSKYKLLWKRNKAFKRISGLVVIDDFLAVLESASSELYILNAYSGTEFTRFGCDKIPGGITFGAIAGHKNWVLIFDSSGSRIVRLRMNRQ